MRFDVIIVGGSFAGQAAALQLGRARRRVLVLDAGRPRNRFARSSHGFLGQDGVPPADMIFTFSDQLDRYGTVERSHGEAIGVSTTDGWFQVAQDDGTSVSGRRLILASGIRDRLPPIPGVEERWGVGVLHCPYCHGYELGQKPIGVLGDSELAFHQAMLVADWGPTTLFLQNTLKLDEDQEGILAERDVTVECAPVMELLGHGQTLEAVRLADDRTVQLAGLFVAPKTEITGNLAVSLGCVLDDGPTGHLIAVDGHQQTSVPGVFAAGDVASAMSNATLSAASGVRAAAAAHRSLIFTAAEAV
ncbi:NAD(P)/FAD-dependent oxidoreductase [Hoeflea prorocentri]|uniref:Thioredoxin reductase n=1 Tax=Hoeflea prorocentri TaxID=1922333 RepID=A0A9X3ULK9_9HYPH|nr:NAD(P)/FAD-dependent oxidoreductase [Hoeflea prorocentri]MCY6383493.1 NAD(P)/FAD-dependent oxidoreductase [Hoeflea prorocentri]MDA5401293.1 NAD(P)/FAD-dependent oxidoreductase [Hoeflea prorocentri]